MIFYLENPLLAERILQIMNPGSVSARDALNEFLRISAPEPVRLALKKQLTNVGDLLEKIQAAAPLWSRGKPVVYRHTIEPHLPRLMVDKALLYQVIYSILAIAARYGEPDMELALSVRRVTSLVVFSVEYRGHHIPEDEIASLGHSSPFRAQVADSKSSLESELAYIRNVVHAHHGHVWVEEDAGGAMAFSFILPAND